LLQCEEEVEKGEREDMIVRGQLTCARVVIELELGNQLSLVEHEFSSIKIDSI
jgi:hypothetical protein